MNSDGRVSLAWSALESVEDPEIPTLSIVDLGLIRSVNPQSDGVLEVGLSPTYIGCPATEVIRHSVEQALRNADNSFAIAEAHGVTIFASSGDPTFSLLS